MNIPVRTIQVQKIRSIGLTVIDAEESKDFYTKALLFKPISDITVEGQYSDLEGVTDTKIRIVTLQLGDETIELMQYLDIKGKPIPKDSQSNDLWFQHMAIVVSDMDAAYTHLQSYPIDRISDKPQTIPQSNQTAGGVRAFKFKDPNGHDLELIWFPPDKGQDKWHSDTEGLFLGIDHSAVTIANTEQSLQFYQDILGMQVESSSLNQGETQARLDGLPEAEVKVTGLRPAQGGLGIELLDYIKPGNGRPIPNDQKSYDIPHMQVEFVVNDIEKAVDILKQNQVEFVSSQLVKHQGCLIKDPNGHAILLIMQ